MEIRNHEKIQAVLDAEGNDAVIMEILQEYSPYVVDKDDRDIMDAVEIGAEVGKEAKELDVKPFFVDSDYIKMIFVLKKDQEKALLQDIKVYLKENRV